MTEKSSPNRLISRPVIIAALAFGVAGWLTLKAGIFIPIIGTEVYADLHELFITLGAALSGPIGGAATALIADSARPPSDFKAVAIIAHILGGLWMGFAYKTLVYRRLKIPLLLAGWAGLVLVYYYLILAPTILVMVALGFSPPEFVERLGAATPWQLYYMAAKLGTPEALTTIIITTIIIAALPPKYRRPLW